MAKEESRVREQRPSQIFVMGGRSPQACDDPETGYRRAPWPNKILRSSSERLARSLE